MPKRRKIEITIQTDRRVEIYATGVGRRWCQRCDAETEVVTPQAASLLAESLRVDLTRGSALSDLHMPASSDGAPLICLESLLELAGRDTEVSGMRHVKGLLPEK